MTENNTQSHGYCELAQTIFTLLFGKDHPIAVSELLVEENNKKVVHVFIVPGKEWFPKVIGKEGQVINLIENFIKIKSYLNHHQAIIKVEK